MTFAEYVLSFQSLYSDALGAKLQPIPELRFILDVIPKRIAILAPHPDDECLMAGLALRAKEETRCEVGVIPFSFGSKLERQKQRRAELMRALAVLEFNLVDPRDSGEHELNEAQLLDAFKTFNPDLLILPHSEDGHPAHIRCSAAGTRALNEYQAASGHKVKVFTTEFWQSMKKPVFLIPLAAHHVVKMGEALLCHEDEVKRNPYHLTLPGFLMDQARRGSEMVSFVGAAKANLLFGQIYGSSDSN